MKKRFNILMLVILTQIVLWLLIIGIAKEETRKQAEKLSERTEIETEISNEDILVAERHQALIEPQKAVRVKESSPEPKEAPEPILEPMEAVAEIATTTEEVISEVETATEPELISLGEFKLTAYCNCEKCCGKWAEYGLTASGTVPEEGRTIAADWDVLPEGTAVLIDGKEYIVEDSGSGVDGKHIDVFFNSHRTALEFGVQYKEVFVEGGVDSVDR